MIMAEKKIKRTVPVAPPAAPVVEWRRIASQKSIVEWRRIASQKSIVEWRRIASQKLDEDSFTHAFFIQKQKEILEAQERIKAYEDNLTLLKSIKNLKKALKILKNKPGHALICPYGDIHNVIAQWQGKWSIDNFGKICDDDPDEMTYAYCTKHDDVEIKSAGEIAEEIEGITEFAGIVKLLKKADLI